MSKYVELIPKTENPPAKVKDAEIIAMVKAGAAAYNAKSSELLLLPLGDKKRREISSALGDALFARAGFQRVDCGSDQAVMSIAERYVREWKEAATAFADERSREIRLLAWHLDEAEANARMAAIEDALGDALPSPGKINFAVNCEERGATHRYLLANSEPGALNAVDGFACETCGKAFLPDSPYRFGATQPGANEEELPLEDIETPGANTIKDLCVFLGLDIEYTLKAMLYVAVDAEGHNRPVATFVRGDYNVSMPKLSAWLEAEMGLTGLRTAEKSELYEMVGEVAGYCGPVGMPENVVVVCDTSVTGAKNTVVGANRPGYHRKGCCHGRDFDAPIADIAQLTEGVPCECGKGKLAATVFRQCGSICVKDATTGDGKKEGVLSYRDREGAHEYSYVLSGDISIESLLLTTFRV